MTISVLFAGEEVVEEVLQQNGDHGVRGDSGVVGGEADPQAQNSFVFDAFGEAVDEALVGQHSIGVYVKQQLLGRILSTLVLTLSKGSEQTETATPEMAEATRRMFMVSFFSPRYFCSCSFDSLYPTRCEQLTDIALATVGTDPRQSPRTPSSL